MTEDIPNSKYTIDHMSDLGFRLRFLTKPFLPGERKFTIKIKCCLSGRHTPFIFPDDVVPVSGLYHIQSSHNLQTLYVLQLEHCVDVKDVAQCSFFHIVCADSCFGPPYRFQFIKRGIITKTHAKVVLSKFSWFAIVADKHHNTRVLPLYTLKLTARLKQVPKFIHLCEAGTLSEFISPSGMSLKVFVDHQTLGLSFGTFSKYLHIVMNNRSVFLI